MEKLVKNRIYTAVIAGYTHDALGVCEIEGNKVFVPGALKGEKCEILIVKAGNDISYGKLINIIDPSPNRVSPLCPYYRLCGGCSTRHMSYEEELDFKLSRLNSALKHIGIQELICNKIIASDITERYRNKAIFDVSSKDGRAFAGFYRNRTHDVTEIGDCLLQKELFSKIALHTVSFINDHGIKAYDEATGKGVLRKIFLRSSRDGSSVVLCLVCAGGFGDCTSLFVKETIARFPEISGIVININKKTGNSVLGDKFYTLYGEPDIKDSLNGIFFNISPASFYQVNPIQAEKLYNEALSFAEPAGKTVLDLYCGAGTITLNLAKHAKTVIGSEIVPEAVENAENNAKMNGISNACFICCDCSELKDRFGRSEVRPDCIVVDPPRKGLAKDVIGYIAELSPESVVYVSCNPETLARDIRIFNTYGYVLKKITAVDMFPGTFHVETVVLVTKNQANLSLIKR